MKLATLLILLGSLTGARLQAQISYTAKNASLESVFQDITRQYGYNFLSRPEDLAGTKKVSFQVRNVSIDAFLKKCLEGQGLDYSVEGKNVFISRKPTTTNGPKEMIAEPASRLIVRGRVINEGEEPVPGVTVLVKGQKTGVSTDAEGEFELNKVDPRAILVFSSVSIKPVEVSVDNRTKIEVNVEGQAGILDEVNVIAYGKTTQRTSPGNQTTIKARDIEKNPVNNPLLALTGRVPGLFITPASGVPGAGITVRVQGQNSLWNGNDPLYVIDGIPYASQMLPTYNAGLSSEILGMNGSAAGSPLSYINPSDIESIDILKDADATAIYGSRAANGAILITTKKGKNGPMDLQVRVQTGFGKVPKKLDMLNSRQYIEMRREALKNDQDVPEEARDYDILGVYGWDTTRTTDWQKELIGNTANFLQVNSTLTGGSRLFQYLVGGTFQKETTVFPGNFSDTKGGINFNLSVKSINEKFSLTLSGLYNVDNNKLPKTDLTAKSIMMAPTAPALYGPDGTLSWGLNTGGNSTWDNPLLWTLQNFKSKSSNLLSNLQLGYQLTPSVDAKLSIGYNTLVTNSFVGIPLESFPPADRPFVYRMAEYSDNKVTTLIIEPQLTYKRNLWIGKLDALAGATFQQNEADGVSYAGEGYLSNELMEDRKSAARLAVQQSVYYLYKYNAVFGRLQYNVKGKHVLNASLRRDGSSRFGEKNRFHNFFSTAYAWILSEESFLKNNVHFLSFAKIKASYGTSGSDQIGNYTYLNLYGPVNIYLPTPYQGMGGLEPYGLPNSYLEWEETRKINIGVDLAFLNDRFFLSANYGRNRSYNQLLTTALPSFTGFPAIITNLPAKVQNESWEFMLNNTLIGGKDLQWNVNFNLTIPRNRLLAFEGLSNTSYSEFFEVGHSINLIRLFKLAGVDQQTGIYQFITADNKVSEKPDPVKDRHVIRDRFPAYYGGLENRIRFRNWELSFLFQFSKQLQFEVDRGIGAGIPGFRKINQPLAVLERWRAPGDISTIQRFNTAMSANGPSLYEQWGNMIASDANSRMVFYTKLRNASLSWEAPQKLIKSIHLRSLRAFVNGQNLFILSDYNGLDPETGSDVLPQLRLLVVGLQIGI